MSYWPASLLAALLVSCEAGKESRVVVDTTAAVVPIDSLAVSAPGGAEIWFTLARPGRLPDGTECTERGIEVRRGGTRIPVPLLYTREAPRILNDSTARAVLYTGCRAGNAYLVDLRSGRPTREHR
ncbi:MAG: hypothetical protein ACREL3_01200 [Gemmatimonadales bacterium]